MSLVAWCQAAVEAQRPHVCEKGTLRIHALHSCPRPVCSLYPLAHVHPTDARADEAVPTWQEHVIVTAAYRSQDAWRLAYALELYVYTLPRERAGLVYVSKLDSSGYGPPTPSPAVRAHLPPARSLTSTLTAAALHYFLVHDHWTTPIDHISLHVLARAQDAYLFPSSHQHPNKRVLSDAALIRWWQTCLSHVALSVQARAFYIIPGYTRLDSHAIVPLHPAKDSAVSRAQWQYGHPYHVADVPLPLHPCSWEHRHAATRSEALAARVVPTMIPVFPDDPKGRFVNELAATAHEPGASMKPIPRAASLAHREAMAERQALERLSVDGFWERMGFRQECCSGNAVGIFVLSTTRQGSAAPSPPPKARPCSLPHPMLEDLLLKHMMQDACVWHDPSEAATCTQRLFDAMDRAIQRKGGGDAAPYADVTLPAISTDVLERAPTHPPAHAPPSPASVRVLPVKKKARRS